MTEMDQAEQPSSPVAAAGPSGPVGRSVGEIRADLAPSIETYGGDETRGVRSVQHWQLHFGEHFVADTSSPEAAARWQAVADERAQLLAEVEAAHRFEQAAGVEREALLAELAAMTRYADAQVRGSMWAADELRSSRGGVVQAAEAACVELDALAAEQESHTGTLLVAVARAYRDATKTVRAALAVAADAPQPEDGCAECTEAGTKNCTAGCRRAGQR